MQAQTAKIIDLQEYRRQRATAAAQPAATVAAPVPVMMQPVMMWMPVWGFVPMMAMGTMGDAR